MADNDWIKLHRKTLENPVVMKDPEHLAIWIYLLCKAVWKPVDVMFGGKRLTLKPGQLTTGRKQIAEDLKISESKVQRVLKSFEIEHQIEQQTSNKCRLISILRWHEYQNSEQQGEQQLNNNRTTTEQQLNTKEEYKKYKKDKKGNNNTFRPPTVQEVKAYCIERGNNVDPETFVDFYQSKGWKVGKEKMKDWKAAVRNWERNRASKPLRATKADEMTGYYNMAAEWAQEG